MLLFTKLGRSSKQMRQKQMKPELCGSRALKHILHFLSPNRSPAPGAKESNFSTATNARVVMTRLRAKWQSDRAWITFNRPLAKDERGSLVDLESKLIQFQTSRTKIDAVSLIRHTSWFFVTQPVFSYDLTSSRYNFETKVWSPKPTIFSESWVHTESVVTGPKKLSRWKLSGMECITKKTHFRQFPCADIKKCCAQFWCHRLPT